MTLTTKQRATVIRIGADPRADVTWLPGGGLTGLAQVSTPSGMVYVKRDGSTL